MIPKIDLKRLLFDIDPAECEWTVPGDSGLADCEYRSIVGKDAFTDRFTKMV
jgi:hypothetical protein